ncbi:hypothetical protein ANCDUO_05333 [Ancylostoma duodenale]|uniref:Uncharacterized protein n=1 Tax=Ancylostoma duodenale TaxID=51022 RepID=A0A0C2D4G2_9BILA|nr:hypothetical protein ANCDUO_05333 [Ancylostoma duodenale]
MKIFGIFDAVPVFCLYTAYQTYQFCTPKPDKWRPRRKLLTPTFHYEILKDFVEVYNRHGRTLLGKFLKHAENGQYEDIFHSVTLCTLDVICEAALGICIEAQRNPHSPYLEAVFR